MAKKYIITQKINLNGNTKSVSFQCYLDEADLIALLALLEGGYEVKEVNDSLSDITHSDTLVTSSNPVTSIGMVGPQNQFESIRPFSGAIYFKQTATVDDIANVLKVATPFALLPTEKPTRVTVKRYETRA
jgi:hypothetical protein